MPADTGGATDDVTATLNPDPDAGPDPDAKGPDPTQWGDDVARDEGDFDEGVDAVKGPDPAQWGDQ